MQIAARTGAWSGKPLPYLRRVAYLEGHGTEYIDTGILPSSLDGNILSIRAAYTGINQVGCLYGAVSDATVSGNVNAIFYQLNKTTTTNQFRLITNNGDVFYIFSNHSEMNDYEVNANILSINGSVAATGIGKANIFRNLILFARSQASNIVNQFGKWRIESAKYTSQGVTMFDYIPVLDLSGRPCFYNKAPSAVPATDPSRYFYNQGTGEFGYGELSQLRGGGY